MSSRKEKKTSPKPAGRISEIEEMSSHFESELWGCVQASIVLAKDKDPTKLGRVIAKDILRKYRISARK